MSDSEPLYAAADFCLIPMGTGTPSVGDNIAECARVLQRFQSRGLIFKMHGYGTNLEGPWPLVSEAIHACHAAVHAQGVPRIATDIRIGTKSAALTGGARSGKMSENERKLESVRQRLEGEPATRAAGASAVTGDWAPSNASSAQPVNSGLQKGAGGSVQQGDGAVQESPIKEGAIPARPSVAESTVGLD